ncbi:uncharacterized protein LOC143211135 [Lasioglossum baleicum]|uniref:uncharacterized protein LOC143211135 n=1 Tax=Lasioglossum baleicum TaxID=434251 RepID=UPI003FCDC373
MLRNRKRKHDETTTSQTDTSSSLNNNNNKRTREKLLDNCVNLVTVHGRPFSLINDTAFQDIIKMIPSISRSPISSQEVRNAVKIKANLFRDMLNKKLNGKLLSLKIDTATCMDRSFLGINVQYLDGVKIVLNTLAVKEIYNSHTAVNIQRILKDVLLAYGISVKQIYSITTDNGSNMIKLVRLVENDQEDFECYDIEDNSDSENSNSLSMDELRGTRNNEEFQLSLSDDEDTISNERDETIEKYRARSVRCAAHTLQLAVTDVLKDSDIAAIITNARRVCKKLRTPVFKSLLKALQKKKPIIDCPTRWHSTLDMLEALLELRECCNTSNDHYLHPLTWIEIGDIVRSLLPARIATKRLQEEQLLIGDFYKIWSQCILETSTIKTELAEKLVTAMKLREKNLFDNDVFLAGMFLDVRFNIVLNQEQIVRAKTHLASTWEHKQKLHKECRLSFNNTPKDCLIDNGESDNENVKYEESVDDEWYEPEEKKRHWDNVSLDTKIKTVTLARRNPSWSLSTLQSKGSKCLKNKKYLLRWENYIKDGGTIYDKYNAINQWTYDRFKEARANFQQVTTRDLQQWALAAASQYKTDNFQFKASKHWIKQDANINLLLKEPQYTVTMSGKLLPHVFLCMQEPTGYRIAIICWKEEEKSQCCNMHGPLQDYQQKEKFSKTIFPETFEMVLRIIGPALCETNKSSGRKPIPAQKQLLIAIWFMATPDSYRSVSTKFGVGKATAFRALRRVTFVLHCIAPRFITWPRGQVAVNVMQEFEKSCGFPNVIGAIDGTHIKIRAPSEDANSYINRKGFHSINVQVICNSLGQFTHVYAGQVGSVHDSRVFRNSPVARFLELPAEYFPNNSHIIGDAAYSIHPHVMVPFRNNGHLTNRQINFNYCLSSTRMAVERAIGSLKMRFRALLDCLSLTDAINIPEFTLACCVLHNICLLQNDEMPAEIQFIFDEEASLVRSSAVELGKEKRITIMNALRMRRSH